MIKIIWLLNLGEDSARVDSNAYKSKIQRIKCKNQMYHVTNVFHMYRFFILCILLFNFIMRHKSLCSLSFSHTYTYALLFADNPVLCDAGLADLTVALEVNHAKVYGVGSDCPTTTTLAPPTAVELTSALPLPPLPPTLLLAAAAAASGGNVSFAATLE